MPDMMPEDSFPSKLTDGEKEFVETSFRQNGLGQDSIVLCLLLARLLDLDAWRVSNNLKAYTRLVKQTVYGLRD